MKYRFKIDKSHPVESCNYDECATFVDLQFISLQPNECPCSNCDEYIESLKARETATNGTGESISTSVKPTVSGLLTSPQKDWVVVDESQKEELSTFDSKMETAEKIKQKGCGMQIINGMCVWTFIYKGNFKTQKG